MTGAVLSTAFLGVLVTKLVDLARKFDTTGNAGLKWLWQLLAIVFGIVIALVWQVDMLRELGIASTSRLQGITGQILTGALAGGFGSGWHEVFDALSSAAKSARANAAATADAIPIDAPIQPKNVA